MTEMRKEPSVVSSARLESLRAELAQKIVARQRLEGVSASAIPGLSLYRRTTPTACATTTYEPRLIVFVQGEKRINLNGKTFLCNGTTYLLNSVDLPVVSQVTKASAELPILALMLDLEIPVIREILSEEENPQSIPSSDARGMAVGATTAELYSACLRLLDLLDSPKDIPFLGKLIKREIFYRLLNGPLGGHLRAIATLGEQSNRTARAASWLRENYNKPLRVEELASIARMGVSTLHRHFQQLTGMSPLQYQKRLRLQIARERMLTDGLDANRAAFDVGYESASHFNREYTRLFGKPPIRDIRARLIAGDAGVHD
jgi:AraC-like DNA-binding protein